MSDTAVWHQIWTWMKHHDELLNILGLLSLAMFFGTIIAVSLIIIMLPRDFLIMPENKLTQHWPPAFRLPFVWGKNILGFFLILAGIAMLVLPGQGLLTIFVGLMMAQFPGKRRLVKRFLSNPKILNTINGLRRKAHRAPLTVAPRKSRKKRAPAKIESME